MLQRQWGETVEFYSPHHDAANQSLLTPVLAGSFCGLVSCQHHTHESEHVVVYRRDGKKGAK